MTVTSTRGSRTDPTGTSMYAPVPPRRYSDLTLHAVLQVPHTDTAVQLITPAQYAARMLTALRRDCPGVHVELCRTLVLPGLEDLGPPPPDTHLLSHVDLAGTVAVTLTASSGRPGSLDVHTAALPARGRRLVRPDSRRAHPRCAEGADAVGRWIAAYLHHYAAVHEQARATRSGPQLAARALVVNEHAAERRTLF